MIDLLLRECRLPDGGAPVHVAVADGRIASVGREAPAAREPMVLFVGAIQRRKNIARLIRAFERLPKSWKLVLAGSAEGYGAAEELRAMESSPLNAR